MVANPYLIGINIPRFTRDFSDFINGFMNLSGSVKSVGLLGLLGRDQS